MMAMNYIGFTDKHRTLDDIFQFSDIPRPMVRREHVDRWC
jgi:hypothetical protein